MRKRGVEVKKFACVPKSRDWTPASRIPAADLNHKITHPLSSTLTQHGNRSQQEALCSDAALPRRPTSYMVTSEIQCQGQCPCLLYAAVFPVGGMLSRRHLFFPFWESKMAVKAKGSSWKDFRKAQWEVLYVVAHDSTLSAAVSSQSSCCSSLWFLAEQGSPSSMKAGLVSKSLQCGWDTQFILGSVLTTANIFFGQDWLLGVPIKVKLEGKFWWTCLEIPLANLPPQSQTSAMYWNALGILHNHLPYTQASRNIVTYMEWAGYGFSWRAWEAEARDQGQLCRQDHQALWNPC